MSYLLRAGATVQTVPSVPSCPSAFRGKIRGKACGLRFLRCVTEVSREQAERSKGPKQARAILVAATTGIRRAELCGLRTQIEAVEERARAAGVELVDDPFAFTDSADGSVQWKPTLITRNFQRLRARVGLDHLDFHDLRKFMETYGQEMGYSITQVALRAGRNPAVAARHYSGRVTETDRALAAAVASLLVPTVSNFQICQRV